MGVELCIVVEVGIDFGDVLIDQAWAGWLVVVRLIMFVYV